MPCTNPICIEGGTEKTHKWEKCGRKGGPLHEAFIAKKREEVIAKNEAEKKELGNMFYNTLLEFLTNMGVYGKTGEQEVRELYPFEDFTRERIAGKIVGMIMENGLGVLKQIAASPDRFINVVIEAITVLREDEENQQKAEHE